MKLSTHLRYGLRAMIVLAKRYLKEDAKPTPVSIKEISKNQDVSEAYLRQIFYSLRKAGLIKAERGKNGGYLLALQPSKISILDVANGLGETLSPVACVDDPSACTGSMGTKQCLTWPLWVSVQAELNKLFSSTSLENLSGSNCGKMLGSDNAKKKKSKAKKIIPANSKS